MKKEGEKLFNEGLVNNIKGKKIDNIYHIYGSVSNKTKSKEFNTHIKINLADKTLQDVTCTCDDFKELSHNGYSFMCGHLIATAYKFFRLMSKGNPGKSESSDRPYVSGPLIHHKAQATKLVRIVSKDSTYYEAYFSIPGEKLKIQPNELRTFLNSISSNKINFKYEFLEFSAPIFHKDLPLTFTLKNRDGYLVLTTHKQLPVPLSDNNNVYLYKSELYLPSKNQIGKYTPLYERFKNNTEILYKMNIENYNKILSLISSISPNINISEDIRSFAAGFSKPNFYMYKEDGSIYCNVSMIYADKEINILEDNQGNNSVIRNYKQENLILIEAEKRKFIKRKDRLMFIGGDEDLFNILSFKKNSIHNIGNVIFGKGLKDMHIYGSSSIDASFYEHGEYIDLCYNIKNIENSELSSMLDAYKSSRRFYKTKDNNFIDFQDDGVNSFFNLLSVLSIDNNIENGSVQIDKSKTLYISESLKLKKLGFIKGTEFLREFEDKLNNLNKINSALPKSLKGVLREYQAEGYRWLKRLSSLGFGGILADEMGLGKTIQTIAFILSEENKKTIIICPTSLIYNWKEELEKFAPSLKAAVIHGEKHERTALIENQQEYDVILTTYGTLRMDIAKYENIVFDYCIIDEGQNIKNSLAQNTKVVKEIKAKGSFALTGTPIENSLTELWSIFDFIMPGYLYSREAFENIFINNLEDNMETLKLLISPFILRRTKKEVVKELPDKIEKKFLVEMTEAQKSVYSSYIKQVKNTMKNNKDIKIEIFSYLTRLRQICLDPSLVLKEYKGGSGKLNVALDLIDEHISSGSKVLLFSQFTSVLGNIGRKLHEMNIAYFHLDGSTKPVERLQIVNEFNNSEDTKVFLISLKAGGTGLNLTSANLVIHFDPWWNPAVENQATDRAHRIGQKNVVEVIKLVAKGTIEEKILLLQQDKNELIQNVITGELKNSNTLNKLSKEDLMKLFER